MRRLLFLLLVVSTVSAYAQKKPVYTASIEADLLMGDNKDSHSFLFSNGIAYRKWTADAGVGIDSYVFRSVPVFADIKKQFGHHRIRPFVNASAGINFSKEKESQKLYYYNLYNADYKNGFYGRITAGASLPIYKRCRFFLSGGYSYKTTRVTYLSYIYNPDMPNNQGVSKDIYRFNRWSLAIGISL